MKKAAAQRSNFKSTFFIALFVTALISSSLFLTSWQLNSPSPEQPVDNKRTLGVTESAPVLFLDQSSTVQVGETKTVTGYLVNMGIPLSKAFITVRIKSAPLPTNIKIQAPPVLRGGWDLYDSYFNGNIGDEVMAVIHFKAVNPEGYNLGSAQQAIFEISYLAGRAPVTMVVDPNQSFLLDMNNQATPLRTFESSVFAPNNQDIPTPNPQTEAEITQLRQQLSDLDTQVQQQNQEIQETKSLVQQIIDFLKQIFRF